LTDAAARLAAAGHPCELVSAGGTGTYLITGANSQITEVQAGSYVFMDSFHERLLADRFEVALTVLGSVISRQGSTVVLDFGRKSVSTDFGTPKLLRIEGATVRSYAEEHCLVDFSGTPPVQIGDRVETMVDYAPTAVALHDVFHVVERGVVTDIWAIDPRGSGLPPPPR
jgi:D-serine deaminase-like pyridoxal phosphate-dependent protein